MVEHYPDGFWLVEFGSISESRLVPNCVAEVLGIQDRGGEPLMRTRCRHLRPQRLLLVFDTCEHVVGRWADAARLAGYVDAVFTATGLVREPNEARARARLDHVLGDRLDTKERADPMAEGAAMTEENACRLALAG